MKLKDFFSIIAFFSAFLLFILEPLIIKYLLPFFGSSSSVWITGSMYFQAMLLLGYIYSYLLIKYSYKIQTVVHGLLVLIVMVTVFALGKVWGVPILPSRHLFDFFSQHGPSFSIFSLLLFGVGLPFFLLSTTTILLQKWYNKISGDDPYFLYRSSNVGSFAGLISYPILVEPYFSIHNQATLWSILFLCFSIVLLIPIFSLFKIRPKGMNTTNKPFLVSRKQAFKWVFYSSIPVFVMLAFTNQMTQGVSPIPFLWVVPLGIYLFSFVVGFKKSLPYRSSFLVLLFASAFIGCFYRVLALQGFNIISFEIVIYSILLFLLSAYCHHVLYTLRPNESLLGLFYIIISAGGFLGSFFIAIVAPSIFNGLWETEISMVIAMILSLIFFERESKKSFLKSPFLAFHILGVSSLVLLSITFLYLNIGKISQTRNFYGVLTVKDGPFTRYLANGSIMHGSQYLESDKKDIPTTYYTKDSGLGIAIRQKQSTGDSITVGTVGLGVGTTAAYCRENDRFVFYEINPEVVEIANKHFTFLSLCPDISTVMGDARLSLEKEEAFFDVLSIDAFTDDSIPLHLLTKEAFEIYIKRLKNDGILAIHISNRYLDLNPPVAKHAKELGFNYVNVPAVFDDQEGVTGSTGEWILLSKDEALLSKVREYRENAKDEKGVRDFSLWTDDYSSVLPLVRFK